jgi:peptide-methionine (R)-S-oxide reductase
MSSYDLTPLTSVQIQKLAADLSPEERRVILDQGTERAFCGLFLDNKKKGTYVCRLCGLPLFASDAKFESGTGWPSFFRPVDDAHVAFIEDDSHGMRRTEIRCKRCDGHLGHVFPDGPPPTHQRYCLNSVSLAFVDDGVPLVLRKA